MLFKQSLPALLSQLLSLVDAALCAKRQTLLRVATPVALTGSLPVHPAGSNEVFSKYGSTVEAIATRNEQMAEAR